MGRHDRESMVVRISARLARKAARERTCSDIVIQFAGDCWPAVLTIGPGFVGLAICWGCGGRGWAVFDDDGSAARYGLHGVEDLPDDLLNLLIETLDRHERGATLAMESGGRAACDEGAMD